MMWNYDENSISRKHKKEQKNAMMAVPMINIIFLILIFFLIGGSLTAMRSKIDDSLPTTDSLQRHMKEEDQIEIAIIDNGYLIMGEPFELEDLDFMLDAVDPRKVKKLIIKPSKEENAQKLIDLMKKLETSGYPAAEIISKVR